MLFKSAVGLISEKKHLTLEGIKEIISFRAAMNLGLTDTLKESFSDVIPKERPIRSEGLSIFSPYLFLF